jgi:DnaJ-class molecular chaperone
MSAIPFIRALQEWEMVCPRCHGEGWLEPIGPCADGSYITSRECPRCRGDGKVSKPLQETRP